MRLPNLLLLGLLVACAPATGPVVTVSSPNMTTLVGVTQVALDVVVTGDPCAPNATVAVTAGSFTATLTPGTPVTIPVTQLVTTPYADPTAPQQVPVTLVASCPLGDDGTLTGEAGGLAFYLGSATDSGRWWVAGNITNLLVWDVAAGRVVQTRPRLVAAGCNFAWSADSKWLLVQDAADQAKLLETGSWRELVALPAPTMMRSPAFSPDGQWLALPGEKSGVQLWNLPRLRQHLRELGLDWD